jgi:hypothetical protein
LFRGTSPDSALKAKLEMRLSTDWNAIRFIARVASHKLCQYSSRFSISVIGSKKGLIKSIATNVRYLKMVAKFK